CCGGDHPMVGTAAMVDALIHNVFASDIAIRMADEGRSSPTEWIKAFDIQIPENAKADPVHNRHPEMEPFVIYEDELVKVSTILVDHRICFPAFGFGFDSKYGSVVISRDTTYAKDSILLSNDSDRILHEVIALDTMFATFPQGPTRIGIAVHLEESHTSYEKVGVVAQEANVKALILHHIVPNTPDSADVQKMVNTAQNDFDGLVLAAEDNDTFNVIDIVKTHLDERK